MTRVLDVKGLTGGYGSVQILYGIDMHIDEGEFVTIIGPNGCGKSTFIKAIFGIADYYEGQVSYKERRISGMRTDQLVNLGIAYVPQVNNVFPSLSVEENLQMGGNSLSGNILSQRIERALDMFPDLRSRERLGSIPLRGRTPDASNFTGPHFRSKFPVVGRAYGCTLAFVPATNHRED